jgi:hypothetical protein
MPGMAADICGVITVILIGGVLLFIGVSTMGTNFIIGGAFLLAGIVAIVVSLKSVI